MKKRKRGSPSIRARASWGQWERLREEGRKGGREGEREGEVVRFERKNRHDSHTHTTRGGGREEGREGGREGTHCTGAGRCKH